VNSPPGIEPGLRRLVVEVLERVGLAVVESARRAMARGSKESLSRVAAETRGDTIYSLDAAVEGVILPILERELAPATSLVLVAEGLADRPVVLPGGRPEDARLVVILDPIDGTRGLMFDKRSAWFLAGAAPRRGEDTRLEDIEAAVQVEIPTSRSELADILSAVKGEGARGETLHLGTGRRTVFTPRPSGAGTVRGGFATIARYFPPGREALAGIDDEVLRRALGDPAGRTVAFEDQYISTGGQLHGLLTGRDRFVADLRPLVYEKLARGTASGLSCHPYDLSAALIAREAGVIVRSVPGGPLCVPLDTHTPVAWAGYANRAIQREIEPLLARVLAERGFITEEEARRMTGVSAESARVSS
jgi:hypothetical protein